MSSWLYRVAACYQLDTRDLLAHDLGHGQVDDLDIELPMSLLAILSQRSGIDLDRLRCMSFAGWVPWLLDSSDEEIPAALETYAFQLSVLWPIRGRKTRSITRWRVWLPIQLIRCACPLRLNDPTDQPLLLVWKLPLMLSCPLHDCWLESYWGVPGQYFGWENACVSPRLASQAISAMDRRTWQALTMGYVDLPRRHIHAGLWFRLLRTLLDELNTPLSQCGSHGKTLRRIWKVCDHALRAGQSLWRPYEILSTAVQLQILEAAATAMHLIEARAIDADEEAAKLFLPEPQTEFTDAGKNKPVNCWQRAMQSLEEVMAEARYNPEVARSLFRWAAGGRQDPESLEYLRAIFAQAQIPLIFLSPDEPGNPLCRT